MNPDVLQVRPCGFGVPNVSELPYGLSFPAQHLVSNGSSQQGFYTSEGRQAFRRQIRGGFSRHDHIILFWRYFMDQPYALSLLGSVHSARIKDVCGVRAAGPESQHLRAPGKNRGAETNLIERDLGFPADDHSVIASQGQHAAACYRVTIKRGHNRFWIKE